MQIDLKEVPQMTIEEFADANQLVMEVRERGLPVGDRMRYYACFKSAEVMESGCLVGAHGDGATPEEAIEDYAAEISTKRIAVDAWKPARREILVPRLVKKPDGLRPSETVSSIEESRARAEAAEAGKVLVEKERDALRTLFKRLEDQLAESRAEAERLRGQLAAARDYPAQVGGFDGDELTLTLVLPVLPPGIAIGEHVTLRVSAALGEGG